MKLTAAILTIGFALAACQGPAEKAGKARDQAAAAASGQAYSGEGPNQTLGRAQDKAEDAARAARKADARALQQQGANIRTQADVAAQRLEDQAQAIRKGAARHADTIDARAKAVAR